jgi:hypothetical protein
VINRKGELVVTGTAAVIAPTEKISRSRVDLPEADFHERRSAT